MRATRVTPEAIADVAEAVAEKIDVLLERATDTLIAAPRPGSPQWHTAWEARESTAGQAAIEQRMLVKIAIALSAGVDPGHEIARAHRAGVPWTRIAAATGTPARQLRQRYEVSTICTAHAASQQLAIW